MFRGNYKYHHEGETLLLPRKTVPPKRRKTRPPLFRHAPLAVIGLVFTAFFISAFPSQGVAFMEGELFLFSSGLNALNLTNIHEQGRLVGASVSKPWKPSIRPKATIAYAISITKCPENTTNVFDGPAILSYSIRQDSMRQNASKYDYKLYAFVFPDAINCSHGLEILGYEVLVRDIPFKLDEIQSESYKIQIEEKGCCGSREFLKLWAYTLVEHEIVVHTDTDVLFLQPLEAVFDAMLATTASPYSLNTMDRTKPLPSTIDFLFTRDYLQRSSLTQNTTKYGVQGGFFVVRPDLYVFQQMNRIILKGEYSHWYGWGNLSYGGYWGSSQIQGFLSYFYGEIRPEGAVELNRCVYNTMVDDPPKKDGKCRTGEETCQDCRETPLLDMISVHLTTCRKPWECPLLRPPHPPRCKEVHRVWFDRRQSLELSWGYNVPTEGWWFPRTLGYCTKQAGIKKRFYLPMKVPIGDVTI